MYKVTATDCDGDIVLSEVAPNYLEAKKIYQFDYLIRYATVDRNDDMDTVTVHEVIEGKAKKLLSKSIKYIPSRGEKKLYKVTVRSAKPIVETTEVYFKFSDAMERYEQLSKKLKNEDSITLYSFSYSFEDENPILLEYSVEYTPENPQYEITVKDLEGNLKFKYEIEQIEDFQKLKEINQEEVDLYWQTLSC